MRRNRGHDRVAVVEVNRDILEFAGVLVGPAPRVPAIRTEVHAGAVDHRHALRPRRSHKPGNTCHRLPALEAATVAPALDRLFDRLRAIADEVVVDVDHQHDRPFTEPRPATVASAAKNAPIALAEIVVPDGHQSVAAESMLMMDPAVRRSRA